METLLIIIGICVAVCALAMIFEIWAWIALAVTAQRMVGVIRARAPHIAAARSTVKATLRENRNEVRKIQVSARELASVARRETRAVKNVRSDAEQRYEAERERAGLVYTDLKNRAQKTTKAVDHGIAEPWREVVEFLRGVELGYTEVTLGLDEIRHHRPAA